MDIAFRAVTPAQKYLSRTPEVKLQEAKMQRQPLFLNKCIYEKVFCF